MHTRWCIPGKEKDLCQKASEMPRQGPIIHLHDEWPHYHHCLESFPSLWKNIATPPLLVTDPLCVLLTTPWQMSWLISSHRDLMWSQLTGSCHVFLKHHDIYLWIHTCRLVLFGLGFKINFGGVMFTCWNSKRK